MDIAIANVVNRARGRASTDYLDASLSTPPYDPTAIAYSLGVKDVCAAPLAIDGHLVESAAGLILEYNDAANRQRQRFTIAHEVGHLLIWSVTAKAAKLPANRLGRKSEIEELCNKIAAEILAPRNEVQRHWALFKANLGDDCAAFILKLSQIFDVSVAFAALRVKDVCGFKIGIGLLDANSERFDWAYGIAQPEWLREVLLTTQGDELASSGRGAYTTGEEPYVRARAFEWKRVSSRHLLVVVR